MCSNVSGVKIKVKNSQYVVCKRGLEGVPYIVEMIKIYKSIHQKKLKTQHTHKSIPASKAQIEDCKWKIFKTLSLMQPWIEE